MEQLIPLAVYAALLAVALIWIWRHPHRAVLLLIAGLPIHTLVMVLISHFVHPKSLVLYEGWKDLVIVVTLARVTLRREVFAGQRLHGLDVVVAALSGIALLTIPLHIELGLRTQLLGLRNDFIFVPLYLLGRLMSTDVNARQRILSAMAIVGVVVTAFAIIEYFVNPLPFLASIEYPKYLSTNFGLQFLSAQGLPYSYFTGGGARRMGSVFLTPVGLAEGGAVSLAAGTALLTGTGRRPLGVAAVVAGILAPALALDRTQLLLTPVLLVVIAVVARKRWSVALAALSAIGIMGLVVAASTLPATSRFSLARLVADPSTSSHFASLGNAWTLVVTSPFGQGLGTAGAVGTRTGHTGGEGQLLVIVSSLGDLGLLLTAIVLGIGMFAAWRASRSGEDPRMAVATLVLLVAVTVTLPLAEVLDNIFVVLCAFWMLGQLIRLEVLSRSRNVGVIIAPAHSGSAQIARTD